MSEGDGDVLPGGLILQGYPLLGEEVFQQGQGQGQNGEAAHQGDPLALVHPDHGHDDHGHNEGHDDAAHHNGCDLVKHRQTAPLRDVPGGERHHQVVAHVKDGVRKGIEQVVAYHDPDHLHGLRGVGDGEQQHCGDCHKGRGQQKPGPGLALPAARVVDNVTHDHVGDGIDDLADNGEHYQERPTPHRGQLEYIGIVDVQISGQHRV